MGVKRSPQSKLFYSRHFSILWCYIDNFSLNARIIYCNPWNHGKYDRTRYSFNFNTCNIYVNDRKRIQRIHVNQYYILSIGAIVLGWPNYFGAYWCIHKIYPRKRFYGICIQVTPLSIFSFKCIVVLLWFFNLVHIHFHLSDYSAHV